MNTNLNANISNPKTNRWPIYGAVAMFLAAGASVYGVIMGPKVANDAKPPLSIVSPPIQLTAEKLGSMDNVAWTDADTARIQFLREHASHSDFDAIQKMIAHEKSTVTRHDFELMRQDRRRAYAANSAVDPKDLLESTLVHVEWTALVPASWGGPNAPTKAVANELFLSGGIVEMFVKPEYKQRASAADTQAFFLQRDKDEARKRLAIITKFGPQFNTVGFGGISNIHLMNPTTLTFDMIDSSAAPQLHVTRVKMPFMPEEWINIYSNDAKEIMTLPSFAKATLSSAAIVTEKLKDPAGEEASPKSPEPK